MILRGRRDRMLRFAPLLTALAIVSVTTNFSAQTSRPFKLGTFTPGDSTFVGIVLKDSVVINLALANDALKSPPPKLPSIGDMKDVISRYDSGIRARIGEILANTNALEGPGRPAYVYDLKSLKTLPPIMYPTTMLNVAVNYRA